MTDKTRKIEYLRVKQLQFDPDNPRLPSTLNGSHEPAVIAWMLTDATIVELMMAIGEKGYFPGEPLLVVPAKKSGFYEVVEGNRRLCAVKLLDNPELAPSKKISVRTVSVEAKNKPSELPVLIYENRNQILDYLGYRHITGIKEWDTLAKARHLDDLLNRERTGAIRDKFRSLARGIGSSAHYVARLITTLKIYEKLADKSFYQIADLSEETIDFSVLLTALSYKEISKFLGVANDDPSLKGLNEKRLRLLTAWLFERNSEGKTRIGESRGLKDLSAIVSHERALAAFKAGRPLADAVLLTGAPTLIFRTSLNNSRKQLSTARDYSHLVEETTEADSALLLEIQKMARDMKVVVDEKLLDGEGSSGRD